MSESFQSSDFVDFSNTSPLYKILKDCIDSQSYESLPIDDPSIFGDNDVWAFEIAPPHSDDMISTKSYSVSGNISTSSYASSDESFNDNILEEDGRISLAYENLRNIPRRLAEKFGSLTKFLDLSHNNFQNLSFLTFFEELHTLILDHNRNLDVNTLPYLGNLKILWLNNCEISNITDWVHRIQRQCPVLEQLSIMGNPGCKNVFNFCTLPTLALQEPCSPTDVAANCRDYILQVLPNLEYLDGASRIRLIDNYTNCLRSSTPSTTNHSGFNGSSASESKSQPLLSQQQQQQLQQRRKHHHNQVKTSPTLSLSFKELFRMKRRKKTEYQSSSTSN